MATRAQIVIRNTTEDDRPLMIYRHYDGYPRHPHLDAPIPADLTAILKDRSLKTKADYTSALISQKGYEITEAIHADAAFLYVVDATTGRWTVFAEPFRIDLESIVPSDWQYAIHLHKLSRTPASELPFEVN